jgi:RimJ/RimL family protein N-acetyltransferase
VRDHGARGSHPAAAAEGVGPGDLQAMNRIYQQREVVRTLVPMTLEDTRAQIDRFTRFWSEDGFGIWAAEDRSTDRLIGRIGLMRHEDWPSGDEVEVSLEKLGLSYRGERDWWGTDHVWYAIDRDDWTVRSVERVTGIEPA